MTRSLRRFFAVIVLCSLPAGVLANEPSSTLSVTPKFGQAPLAVRVTARVEPAKENRVMCLELDGENFYRSSCWDIDGGSAKTTQQVYQGLPAGAYEARLTIKRTNSESVVIRDSFCVLAGLGDVEAGCERPNSLQD